MKNERGITSFSADDDVAELLEEAASKDTGLTKSYIINESVRRHGPEIIRQYFGNIRARAELTLARLDRWTKTPSHTAPVLMHDASSPESPAGAEGTQGKARAVAGTILQATAAKVKRGEGKAPKPGAKAHE